MPSFSTGRLGFKPRLLGVFSVISIGCDIIISLWTGSVNHYLSFSRTDACIGNFSVISISGILSATTR